MGRTQKTQAERMREYRARMKADPVRYDSTSEKKKKDGR